MWLFIFSISLLTLCPLILLINECRGWIMQRRGYACKYNFALVHFFPFCQIMFPKIGSSTVKTLFLHIQNLCIFLMNWLCFHYVMSHFIPGNVLCSEVYFVWYSVQFSGSSHVQLFVTPWNAAHQASLSITNSRSLLKLMSIESVMPSSHLILCQPLLLPSIFPSIRVF